ncbi:uncharacterized protein PHACADRAFT_182430 [Phanerochaete carnosa HHB-10118-sp]|uniref:Uncharacterized protein n=1 Tax=Phanerochaete carnosa (strain HHB-10118-sp) TaxID=650164 RepID=K5WG20_PHACS|nr:uncharacterized protein PHACADRAFT_182430 [Phanerochaete carnosa HHB-10118-sp]EKM58039.1 hypothetical protein PHACADRAFT_182430 [Phanerochaete carnosa HHB-10118-sp]
MPLFGNQNNRNTATGAGPTTGTGAAYNGHAANERVGPLGTGTGPSMDPAQPAPGGGYGHNNTTAGHGAYQQGMTSMPPERYNNQTGVAGDPYANTVGNNDVAPAAHLSSGQRSGKASSTTGKMERIAGTMFCNQTLKAKGMQKEQQAQAFAAQSAELSEAQRLEQEASIRRQRAVDHGAHPANKALGGAAQAQEFGGNFGPTGSAGAGGLSGSGVVPGAHGGAL